MSRHKSKSWSRVSMVSKQHQWSTSPYTKQTSSFSDASHPQVIVAVESSLVPSSVTRRSFTRDGQKVMMICTPGSVISLSTSLIRSIRLSQAAVPSSIMLIPGHQDLSPRNLAIISTDLSFLRSNQDLASRKLAQRILKPLTQVISYLNRLGVVTWCSNPPTCPAYLKKPYPIPHILYQANLIVCEAISKINSSQKLPHLNITSGLHALMTTVLGKSRRIKRPVCANPSKYLPDGHRLTNKVKADILRRIHQKLPLIKFGKASYAAQKERVTSNSRRLRRSVGDVSRTHHRAGMSDAYRKH